MKISTRGRYGLRAMIQLARCHGQPPLLMSDLAERESLSRKYLHALLTALREAGLVLSIRGKGGGFLLARSPAEINLSQILHALEGPLVLVDCVGNARACDRVESCTAHCVWTRLSGVIENSLATITLEDLIALENQGGSVARDGDEMKW